MTSTCARAPASGFVVGGGTGKHREGESFDQDRTGGGGQLGGVALVLEAEYGVVPAEDDAGGVPRQGEAGRVAVGRGVVDQPADQVGIGASDEVADQGEGAGPGQGGVGDLGRLTSDERPVAAVSASSNRPSQTSAAAIRRWRLAPLLAARLDDGDDLLGDLEGLGVLFVLPGSLRDGEQRVGRGADGWKRRADQGQ